MAVAYLLVALIGAAIALFAIQNINPVVVRFLGWQIESALSLVVLLSTVIGTVMASLVGFVRHWKLRSRIRQLERRLAELGAATEQRQDQIVRPD